MENAELEHDYFMGKALAEALLAEAEGEVPIGAVATSGGVVIAGEHNRTIQRNDPTAHAEILLLREVSRLKNNYRLPGITVYVTLEPCPMCAGALVNARIDGLVFGTPDEKGGGVVSRFRILDPGRLNHNIPFSYGPKASDCADLMKRFFQSRR